MVNSWSITFCDEMIVDSFNPSINDEATRSSEPEITKEEYRKLHGIK